MSDEKIVASGKSPQEIAYMLCNYILFSLENGTNVDRKEYLDTYAECLLAATGYRNYKE